MDSLKYNIREIPKTSLYKSENAELKRGRYISSVFPLEGYGTKRWVVGCYIDIDSDVAEEEQIQVIQEIVDELNQPPKRKKFERKRTSPLYGNLEIFSAKFKKSSDGATYAEVLLVTDDRSNEYFWGEGIQMIDAKARRRKSS